jgi:hypothetical protein
MLQFGTATPLVSLILTIMRSLMSLLVLTSPFASSRGKKNRYWNRIFYELSCYRYCSGQSY